MSGVLRTVNRIVLGLIGLLLVLGGGSLLAVGLGVKPPSWWVYDSKDDVLLSAADRHRWQDEGWWWPTVIAVLGVVVLLALWWLVAQLRRRRLGEVLVDTGDGEGALLRGRALESVLVSGAEGLDGVERAGVLLTGRRSTPQARMGLTLASHAAPGAALQRLSDEALKQARDSAGLASLPAEVRLRAVKHRAERVS
ncbi:alkaline shock response membrane anchor protein AmaP [Streptomyces sp. VRA16 Mangrove soil]|uniref:alkaline shock response membrane anchor protein AmaP n=1 Tax=Streptomyces sp. VRA16 Mangrove soil TaxID=2817434 RepID=UPI001A9FB4F8|nr:alkaline shock response membrane anchor protein AmaP [Streptomyces sp. VRA16 Mangrove soil]MBO1335198.1 alkaline shock response membrane anchor protein AmaP [Streptomyces sp. VRA16 Mangrove soil]